MSLGDLSRINTNVQSMKALGQFNKTNNELGVRQLRLSTGSRLNRAEDDSAGYSIAKKLQAKTRGQAQALANIGDAKSMLTVGEGALNSTMDILQTMKEKAVQAANDTLGTEERNAIQSQLDSLTKEISDILGEAEFNGTTLFTDDAAGKSLQFQVGAESDDSFSVALDRTSRKDLIGGSEVSTVDDDGNPTWNGGAIDAGTYTGADKTFTLTRGDDATSYDYSASAKAAGSGANTVDVTDASGEAAAAKTGNGATAATYQFRVGADGSSLEYSDDGSTFQAAQDAAGNDLSIGGGDVVVRLGDATDNTEVTITDAAFTANDGFDVTVDGSGDATVAAGTAKLAVVNDISSAATFSVDGEANFSDNDYQFRVKSDGATLEYSTDGSSFSDVTTDTAVTGGADGTYSIDDGNGKKLTITLAAGTTLAEGDGFDFGLDQGDSTTTATFASDAGTVAYDSANESYTLTDGSNSLKFSVDTTGSAKDESFEIEAAAGGIDVSDNAGAQAAIDLIDGAINKISDRISTFGDAQSRLTIKQDNLDTSMTNYEAARSRIEDTDFAKEQMEIVKLQILQQTGIGSLAQANSAPQSVLSLLG